MKRRSIFLMMVAFVGPAIAGALMAHRNETMRQLAHARAQLNDGILQAVVLGDSVARGAGAEDGKGISGALGRLLHARGTPARVANLGIDGARTRQVAELLGNEIARSAIEHADVVVISLGGNDLYGDSLARLLASVSPDHQQARVLSKVADVVNRVRRINPAARVYVLGLYNPYRGSAHGPWLTEQVNLWDSRLIARFADARELTVVRISDLLTREELMSGDRFHPGALGYAAIASRILSSL